MQTLDLSHLNSPVHEVAELLGGVREGPPDLRILGVRLASDAEDVGGGEVVEF